MNDARVSYVVETGPYSARSRTHCDTLAKARTYARRYATRGSIYREVRLRYQMGVVCRTFVARFGTS
jgi:hypothetical protein